MLIPEKKSHKRIPEKKSHKRKVIKRVPSQLTVTELMADRLIKEIEKESPESVSQAKARSDRANLVAKGLDDLRESDLIAAENIPSLDNISASVLFTLNEIITLSQFLNTYLPQQQEELMGTKFANLSEKSDAVLESLILANAVDKIKESADEAADEGVLAFEKFLDGVARDK